MAPESWQSLPPPSDTVNILYIDEGQVAVHVPHARDSSKHASAAVPNLNRMVSSTCSGHGSDGHDEGGICAAFERVFMCTPRRLSEPQRTVWVSHVTHAFMLVV